MKSFLAFTFFLSLSIGAFAQTPSEFIHVDQFGYPEDGVKVAVISNPQVGYNSAASFSPSMSFEVRDASSNAVVFSGSPAVWNGGATHSQSGDQGWWFDFSSVTTPGEYYIIDVVNNEQSGNFVISDTVYHQVLQAAGRMFYYNRCNAVKTAQHAGVWSDGDNFGNPLQDLNCRFIDDPSNASLEKDLSGGWFDAGDYNKYVSYTHSTLHNLLSAYEENPTAFSDDWNIPESGNGVPDLIDEIKWELDWLLKMSNADGSVHNKVGSQNYSENAASPPSINTDQRFYGATCSSASIVVASVFARAAKVFRNFPSLVSYANQLEQQALLCFNYAKTFVDANSYELDCDDGSIVSGDSDQGAAQQLSDFMVASIYLFELTDSAVFNNYVVNNVNALEQVQNTFWGPYFMANNEALLLYTTLPGADPTTVTTILNSFTQDVSNNNNGYYGFNPSDLYRAEMPSWSYHWGSSQSKASYGNLNRLVMDYGAQPNNASYAQYIDESIHYFHGVNPQGMVYLSNMYAFGAERSVNEIYHGWFNDGTNYDNALTSSIGPAPGYVTGGANNTFSVTNLSPPYGQPEQKSYLDFNTGYPDNSWEISEPAIYYQAAYVRLLANRVANAGEPTTVQEREQTNIQVYPVPAINSVQIVVEEPISSVVLFSIDGQEVLRTANTSGTIDLSGLTAGVYLMVINDRHHQKIVKQ